ncbi:MAG: hypothetical protein CL764_02780 [Chloroflexi bacterium]|nr:hypothetical protein [Chloroflexota bacterium]|tara:strand:- start:1440 stop:2096 length:657 start_codon:yes stop_codon:yes gene_type:complete
MNPQEVIKKYGTCLELISMDPFFHEITVGLFLKGSILTVHSYSNKDGVKERLTQIRDRIVLFGGAKPIENSYNQATYDCEMKNGCCTSPLRFLLKRAVMKNDDYDSESKITVKDLRSEMQLYLTPKNVDGKTIYTVSGEGEAKKPEIRYRAVVNGFVRYGGCVKINHTEISLQCFRRNDAIMKIILPIARNISATEDILAAEDMAGQMTTQTLGFSST